jgi:alanine dehydrogenase
MNPWTATRALTASTLPYILAMAKGFGHAFEQFPELLGGINTHAGVITKKEVAVPLGLTSMFSELSDF